MRRRRSYKALKRTTKIVGLFLLAAGSILAPISASYAQAKDPLAHGNAQTQRAAFATFAQNLKDLPQFTILGDTDHSKKAIMEFMARMDTMKALQRNGVKHIFIELPPALQHLVDDLREEKISRDQYAQQSAEMFVRTFQNVKESLSLNALQADMILNAQKCGIRVHCIDSNEAMNNPKNPVLKAFHEECQHALEQHVNKNPGQFMSMTDIQQIDFAKRFFEDYVRNLPPERQKETSALLATLMKERVESDGVISKNAAKLAGHEKAVMFYGAEHGLKFSKHLNTRGVNLIALCASQASERKWSERGWQTCNVHTGLLGTPPQQNNPPIKKYSQGRYTP